jgi:DNA-binding MarR family transcriptional regulator
VPDPPRDLKSLLRDAHRALQARVHQRLLDAGYTDLRPAHANVLQFIDWDSGSRVQDIATSAQVSWQAIAELVADLEADGYVVRVPDPTDRRAKRVCLTDRGRELTPVVIGAMQDVEASWAGIVGEEALDGVRETLRALWPNLGG